MSGDRDRGLLDDKAGPGIHIQFANRALGCLPAPVAAGVRTHWRAVCAFLVVFSVLLGIVVGTYPGSNDSSSAATYDDIADEIKGMVMVQLDGGTFVMGSDQVAGADPAHEVTLTEFKISDSEVTNAQYVGYLNIGLGDEMVGVESVTVDGVAHDAVVGQSSPIEGQVLLLIDGYVDDENQCHIEFNGTHFNVDDPAYEDWPATFVEFYGAESFCFHYGLGLPTEAEWEFAARGGDDSALYATGTGALAADLANYNATGAGGGAPVPVRSFDPNPYALYDLSGNVKEWVNDFYSTDFYAESAGATDPENEDGDRDVDNTVVRGGSYSDGEDPLQIVWREQNAAVGAGPNQGFRVVARPS